MPGSPTPQRAACSCNFYEPLLEGAFSFRPRTTHHCPTTGGSAAPNTRLEGVQRPRSLSEPPYGPAGAQDASVGGAAQPAYVAPGDLWNPSSQGDHRESKSVETPLKPNPRAGAGG